MIYLDYSATTKTDLRVMEYFHLVSEKYFANANSPYAIGQAGKSAINLAGRRILSLLGCTNHEIIYTSSATEANNLAIKGVYESFKGTRKRIVTDLFEHSSVIATINYLQRQGAVVDIVRHGKDGKVDLKHLTELVKPDVALVSIGSVNSELGIRQPLKQIARIVHEAGCLFHCDVTQSVGKEIIDFNEIDYLTLSAHKFYGIKGIGALIKRNGTPLMPQIHGGTSTTIYRAGTPSTPLILSMAKALTLISKNHLQKTDKVTSLNTYLRGCLASFADIKINSPKDALPHILNFSICGYSSHEMLKRLSKKEIFISNHSACASNTDKSLAVLALSNDEQLASTSLRVSISHLSKKSELNRLIAELKRIGVK